jgi:hypothetical protein
MSRRLSLTGQCKAVAAGKILMLQLKMMPLGNLQVATQGNARTSCKKKHGSRS